MAYESDWVKLLDALKRLTTSGIPEPAAKTEICNALADRKIRCRARCPGVDVGGRPKPERGRWFSCDQIETPTHLRPDEFDWEASRPIGTWRPREVKDFSAFGPGGPEWSEFTQLAPKVDLLELCREDVDIMRIAPGRGDVEPLQAPVEAEISHRSAPRRDTSGYSTADLRWFDEIRKMIEEGSARSAYGAALLLAGEHKLPGTGSPESIAKRVGGRYLKWLAENLAEN